MQIKYKKGVINMKSIQAINDHVIVQEIMKEAEKTESGIIIPSAIKVAPQKYGKVLSVGNDVKYVKEGDTIVFHANAGQAIIMSTDMASIQRVLKEPEIYGILK